MKIITTLLIAYFSLTLCSHADWVDRLLGYSTGAQQSKKEYETEQNLRAGFLVANAADAAYLDETNVIAKLTKMGITQAKFFNHHDAKYNIDTQAFVASTTYGSLIVFRGTASFRDWVTDLSLWPNSYPGGAVHSGFLTVWNDIKPDVLAYLATLPASSREKRKVWIGGHSLGGSVALLCGIDLDTEGYLVKGIYTFGQPRVLSKKAVSHLKKTKPELSSRIFRFVFSDDPVPSLLSTRMGYGDIGKPYLSKEFGKVLIQQREDLFWPRVGDHSMTNYVKTLYVIMSSSKDEKARRMADWLTKQDYPLSQSISGDWQAEVYHFK